MLWNKEQQNSIDQFIKDLKSIEWFKNAGQPSQKYLVSGTIYEACDVYGQQMLEVWGQNSESIEKEALKFLSDAQIDAVFEMVSLAIGEELYEKLCDFEDRLGAETNEDQSGLEMDILDFIKRDTAWACIELLIKRPNFFQQVFEVNKSGRWACSWSGQYPTGNFIIM